MLVLCKRKDGGAESPVDAYVLIELKSLFSIVLLKFNKGGREAFHTHAFNALTWFIKGDLIEEDVSGEFYTYTKSLKPKITLRGKNHRVKANKDSWCISFRGCWVLEWSEYVKETNITTILTKHRRPVRTYLGV